MRILFIICTILAVLIASAIGVQARGQGAPATQTVSLDQLV